MQFKLDSEEKIRAVYIYSEDQSITVETTTYFWFLKSIPSTSPRIEQDVEAFAHHSSQEHMCHLIADYIHLSTWTNQCKL